MHEILLEASDPLVQRLARESEPVRAVVELIWNAVDGEANVVDVRLVRDEALGGIVAVAVEDDGHGIDVDEVEATFGRIGDSWKARSARTKNDVRGLHGRSGEGRLRAFALGSRVRWESRSIDSGGQPRLVTIEGRRDQRHIFHWDATPRDGQQPTGTIFRAYNDEQRSLAVLERDKASLASHFAPLLLNERGIEIRYDGEALDPESEILEDTTLLTRASDAEDAPEVKVRIIEWRAGKHHAVYFGPDDEHFLVDLDAGDLERQFPFSA